MTRMGSFVWSVRGGVRAIVWGRWSAEGSARPASYPYALEEISRGARWFAIRRALFLKGARAVGG